MSRPSWDQYFMSVARVVASRGTCDRKRVGVVVVRDHNILSTGYNGAVAGLPHCDDVGHLIENDHCVRVSHSESNAICQAAKNGICLNGATMYTTLSPCWPCFKLIVNAGIKKIIYAEFYRDTKIFEAAQQLGIELVQLEESKAASEQDSLQSLQVKLDDRKKVIDCLMAQLKDR